MLRVHYVLAATFEILLEMIMDLDQPEAQSG